MNFEPRVNEKIVYTAKISSSVLLAAKVWASLVGIIGLLLLNKGGPINLFPVLFFCALIGGGPLWAMKLTLKNTECIITNMRLVIKSGIFNKSFREINLGKINDVEVKQSFIQGQFNAADICILTGNDMPTILKNIDHPTQFKNHLTDCISTSGSKAA